MLALRLRNRQNYYIDCVSELFLMRYGSARVARGGPHIVTHARFFRPHMLAEAKTSRKCADDVMNGLNSSKCAEKWCYLPKTNETPKRTMAPKLAILVVFRPCVKIGGKLVSCPIYFFGAFKISRFVVFILYGCQLNFFTRSPWVFFARS